LRWSVDGANGKWLVEIAHTNPLWIHPSDAHRLGVARTGDLVRVETEIGHSFLRAWITEGVRPGVVGCRHHMGRWHPGGAVGQRLGMATVDVRRENGTWSMARKTGTGPFAPKDPDTSRVWWTDVGIHQNLTFAVHPDPVSGGHCWYRAVRVRRAEPGDRHGDISVDAGRADAVYRKWMAMARGADEHSPDGTRTGFCARCGRSGAHTALWIQRRQMADRVRTRNRGTGGARRHEARASALGATAGFWRDRALRTAALLGGLVAWAESGLPEGLEEMR
jgi:hypothetical protein